MRVPGRPLKDRPEDAGMGSGKQFRAEANGVAAAATRGDHDQGAVNQGTQDDRIRDDL